MLMRSLIVAGALLVAGGPALTPAQAQDASVLYGDTLLSVGTGMALLSLPDVQFVKRLKSGPAFAGRFATSTDLAGTVGWNVNGAVTKPIGGNRDISLSGYWASITDSDSTACTGTASLLCSFVPLTNTGNFVSSGVGGTFLNSSQRDVTQAGAAVEAKQWLTPKVMGGAQAPDARYWALGADWRAIYQDLTIDSTSTNNSKFTLHYSEGLDTNYYGVFAAYGGGFTPPFLAEQWHRWGLHSSFRLQGGLYYADSRYSGSESGTLNSNASDSRSDLAFVGGVTLETHKQITPRSALSLENKLEYYSFVPSMNYNDTSGGCPAPMSAPASAAPTPGPIAPRCASPSRWGRTGCSRGTEANRAAGCCTSYGGQPAADRHSLPPGAGGGRPARRLLRLWRRAHQGKAAGAGEGKAAVMSAVSARRC